MPIAIGTLSNAILLRIYDQHEFLPNFNAVAEIVISKEGLKNIQHFKYIPSSYTALDDALNPLWKQLAASLPLWIAPNVITLAAFSLAATSFALTWHWSPGFATPLPRWLYFFLANLWFFW